MRAEILTIGDELLIGQIVDTNSAWIASLLTNMGVEVVRSMSIADERSAIITALDEISARSEIVFVTGGLGPTQDDITKQVLSDYFNTTLEFNEEVFEDVKQVFSRRNIEMPISNRGQAMLPASCEVLRNVNGTAPGMWLKKEGFQLISMPGVPFEMKALMEDEVVPRLIERAQFVPLTQKTLHTQGMGETTLMEKISAWEEALPKHMKLAYLPSAGTVRLRLSIRGGDAKEGMRTIDEQFAKVTELIPNFVFGFDNDTLEEVVGRLLVDKKLTIGTAESCTGGYIGHLLTSIAGSSDYYKGGYVVYSNELKNKIGVPNDVLNKYGAVSEEVVTHLLSSTVKNLEVDCAIAVSGVAGPGGGSEDKPVGTVWIGVQVGEQKFVRKFQFGTNRSRNIRVTAITALNILRKEIA